MFKVKIRKTAEILLHEEFVQPDYPLVSLAFTAEAHWMTYSYEPTSTAKDDDFSSDNIVLEITLPEDSFLKLTGEFPLNVYQETTDPILLRRITTATRNILIDIIRCACDEKIKTVYLKAKVFELLISMLTLDTVEKPSSRWTTKEIEVLTGIKEMISLNLQNNYSIEQLAEISGMNRTKLQEGFKDLFKKTIYAFTTDWKMLKAKMLLENNKGLSLKEVAALLGYRHTNHFSVAFKKRYNFSPSILKQSKVRKSD
jgi:AraC-like DNA-binding protein